MKVFVAYGFTKENQWIKELVYPLVESFGGEVIHGEHVQGEIVSNAVITSIRESDALIGILTKVDRVEGKSFWTTRNWVMQELAVARTAERLFVEVRDNDVDPNRAMLSDRQPITFLENESKEKLLIELALVLCRWSNQLRRQRVCLIPHDLARTIYKESTSPQTYCSYKFRVNNRSTPEKRAAIEKYGETICIHVDGFPEDQEVLIDIGVTTKTGTYSTGWQAINILNLTLDPISK